MESMIRLNHRNKTQLKDIVNYINTIIGARGGSENETSRKTR